MTEKRAIGEEREARLGEDVIRHREFGSGPTLVFVHGVLAGGLLWNSFFLPRYARRLSEDFKGARLRFLTGSRALMPEARREALAAHMAAFVRSRTESGKAL